MLQRRRKIIRKQIIFKDDSWHSQSLRKRGYVSLRARSAPGPALSSTVCVFVVSVCSGGTEGLKDKTVKSAGRGNVRSLITG